MRLDVPMRKGAVRLRALDRVIDGDQLYSPAHPGRIFRREALHQGPGALERLRAGLAKRSVSLPAFADAAAGPAITCLSEAGLALACCIVMPSGPHSGSRS